MSVDAPLQFVDTNILVYAHDRSAGAKHERAQTLLTALWDTGHGCVSVQVLQEFYVNVTRKVRKPLASEEAAQIVADLGLWRVHVPQVPDVLSAIELQQRQKLSFWDALIVNSALQLACGVLWSDDLHAGPYDDTLVIKNPFID